MPMINPNAWTYNVGVWWLISCVRGKPIQILLLSKRFSRTCNPIIHMLPRLIEGYAETARSRKATVVERYSNWAVQCQRFE